LIWLGIVMAVAMVILGPAAAFVVQRANFGSPASDTSG
jgi:hypothetical protein